MSSGRNEENKRLVIIPEMLQHIITKYDNYYNKTTDTNLKQIGEELNALFTDLFGTVYAFDESAYRKTYKSVKDGIDISLKENFSDDEIERIAKMRNRLHFEGRVAKKERQEAGNLINRVADNELIKNVLVEVMGNYQFNEVCDLNAGVKNKSKKITDDGTPIYFYSDVHYGLMVDILNNKYDENIAVKRLNKFFSWVRDDIKKNNYKKVFIIDGADMIEGSCLRISQLVSISQLIIEQSLNYANIMENFITQLAKEVSGCEINFNMVTDSNHTQIRHFASKPNEFNKEDFALVIANLLKEKFKGIKNVKFNYGDVIFLDINGYNTALIHGHQIPKREGEINYLNNMYGKNIDCVIRGHYHSFDIESQAMIKSTDGKYKQQFVITAPSICGNTDYAIKKGYSAMPGGLKIIISDGKLSGINLIEVD